MDTQDPACTSYSQALLYYKGYHAIQTHRIAHALWARGQKVMAVALQSRMSEVRVMCVAGEGFGWIGWWVLVPEAWSPSSVDLSWLAAGRDAAVSCTCWINSTTLYIVVKCTCTQQPFPRCMGQHHRNPRLLAPCLLPPLPASLPPFISSRCLLWTSTLQPALAGASCLITARAW